jgi:hypothetical protein
MLFISGEDAACYLEHMPGAGFAVTRCARHDTRFGGRLGRAEKSFANRRNRRRSKQELSRRGEDSLFTPKLYTGWDVI